MMFVIKVTTNKEDQVAELIAGRAKKRNLNVFSIARPHSLRGYILMEATDRETAEEASYNLPYAKGIINRTIKYEDVKNLLEPVAVDINIEKNDIVEIISDAFKKEKAKVIRVDKTKKEAVVELLGAVVKIPVTVKLDNIKVIRRDKEEKEEEEKPKEEKSEDIAEGPKIRGGEA